MSKQTVGTDELGNILNALVSPFGIARSSRVQEYQEKVEALIRKEVREARIDEMERMNKWFETSTEPVEDVIQKRLAHLKSPEANQ